MPADELDALQLARDFAPEAEEILGVTGIAEELNALAGDPAARKAAQDRMITLGDIGSTAGALVSLFMWIGQLRKGKILRGATTEEVIDDLSRRILDSDELSQAAKERLISRALDRLPARSE